MSEIKVNNIPVITENNGSVELTTDTAKFNEISENSNGAGILLKHDLKNSSGIQIISAAGDINVASIPVKAQDYYRDYTAFTGINQTSSTVYYHIHKSTPFLNDSGVILIGYNMLMKLLSRSEEGSDAFYPFIYKNYPTAEGTSATSSQGGSQLTNYTGHRWSSAYGGDEWTGVHATICVDHVAGSSYSVVASGDNNGAAFVINNCEMWAMLISGVKTS